jgi:hypothetical protein
VVTVPSASLFLASLAQEVGYREEPNPGSNNNKFSRYLGKPAQPWCLDFLNAKAKQQGLILPPGVSTTSYTPTAQKAFQLADRWSNSPSVGAWAFWDFPDNVERTQHVSCVYTWDTATVTTYDGNTSQGAHGSQSNGEWVALRTRSRDFVVGFGLPAYSAPPPPPPAPKGRVGSPVHFSEDNMDRIPISIPVNNGRGYIDVAVDVNSIVSIETFGSDPSDGWDPAPALEQPYARGLAVGQSRIVLTRSGVAKGTVAGAVWVAR